MSREHRSASGTLQLRVRAWRRLPVELGAAPPGPAPHRQPAAPRRSSSCMCSAALWSGSGLRARRSAPRTSVVACGSTRVKYANANQTRDSRRSPPRPTTVVSKRFYNYFSYRSLRCDRVSHAVRLRASWCGAALQEHTRRTMRYRLYRAHRERAATPHRTDARQMCCDMHTS